MSLRQRHLLSTNCNRNKTSTFSLFQHFQAYKTNWYEFHILQLLFGRVRSYSKNTDLSNKHKHYGNYILVGYFTKVLKVSTTMIEYCMTIGLTFMLVDMRAVID